MALDQLVNVPAPNEAIELLLRDVLAELRGLRVDLASRDAGPALRHRDRAALAVPQSRLTALVLHDRPGNTVERPL